MRRIDFLFLAPLVVLAGCQTSRVTKADEANPYALAGTSWLLIQEGSASDADNLTDVAPNAFAMTLDKEGTVSFKFDCNLGTGRWKSSPAAAEGTLQFESTAVSTKTCPAGSLGEQVSASMRGSIPFSIYDGRLTLRTKNPSRIYVWDIVD